MRALALLSVILIASTFAAGCMVGPNYHSPQTKVSEKWAADNSAATKSVTKVDQPPVADWWTTFNDPTLNALIDRAVQDNLDLQLAQARVREARAQRGVVAADLYPTVNVSSSYQRSRISKNINGFQTSTGGSQSNINVTGDLYQVGFDASWEIDVFGGI
ncbi:MAG TPA: TolC family protein, partial [Acidobacteriota bacterium]